MSSDALDRFEHIFEHGRYSQTAEDCQVTLAADGRVTGVCGFEGMLMSDSAAIPVALPAESAIRQAIVDGKSVMIASVMPGIFTLTLPEVAPRGSSHAITLEYEGIFTDGAMCDQHGCRWLELQSMTIWKPVLGFDPCGHTRSRGRLALPASYAVAAGMGRLGYHVDGDQHIVEWDTGSDVCTDYSFVAGEGDWAQRRHGDTELQALIMRDVPYGTAEVLEAAGKLVSLYEDMWGPYRFERLSVACPPSSVSGNCAREGLIIAGMVRDTSPATDRGFVILAHEIAHQWWGDSVYFDWRQLGLLEPLASYGAYRAVRRYFPEQYPAHLARCLAQAKEAEQSGVPLIDCTWSTPHSWYLRESKGACVWLLLERLAGAERLDDILGRFARSFKGRYAGSDDVRAVFTSAAGGEGDQLFADTVLGTVPLPDALDAYPA